MTENYNYQYVQVPAQQIYTTKNEVIDLNQFPTTTTDYTYQFPDNYTTTQKTQKVQYQNVVQSSHNTGTNKLKAKTQVNTTDPYMQMYQIDYQKKNEGNKIKTNNIVNYGQQVQIKQNDVNKYINNQIITNPQKPQEVKQPQQYQQQYQQQNQQHHHHQQNQLPNQQNIQIKTHHHHNQQNIPQQNQKVNQINPQNIQHHHQQPQQQIIYQNNNYNPNPNKINQQYQIKPQVQPQIQPNQNQKQVQTQIKNIPQYIPNNPQLNQKNYQIINPKTQSHTQKQLLALNPQNQINNQKIEAKLQSHNPQKNNIFAQAQLHNKNPNQNIQNNIHPEIQREQPNYQLKVNPQVQRVYANVPSNKVNQNPPQQINNNIINQNPPQQVNNNNNNNAMNRNPPQQKIQPKMQMEPRPRKIIQNQNIVINNIIPQNPNPMPLQNNNINNNNIQNQNLINQQIPPQQNIIQPQTQVQTPQQIPNNNTTVNIPPQQNQVKEKKELSLIPEEGSYIKQSGLEIKPGQISPEEMNKIINNELMNTIKENTENKENKENKEKEKPIEEKIPEKTYSKDIIENNKKPVEQSLGLDYDDNLDKLPTIMSIMRGEKELLPPSKKKKY